MVRALSGVAESGNRACVVPVATFLAAKGDGLLFLRKDFLMSTYFASRHAASLALIEAARTCKGSFEYRESLRLLQESIRISLRIVFVTVTGSSESSLTSGLELLVWLRVKGVTDKYTHRGLRKFMRADEETRDVIELLKKGEQYAVALAEKTKHLAPKIKAPMNMGERLCELNLDRHDPNKVRTNGDAGAIRTIISPLESEVSK